MNSLAAIMKMGWISQEISSGIHPKIGRALGYIHTHFHTNKVNLRETGAFVDLHPGHLCRIFKRETGVNFRRYIHRVRLQRAVFLLLGSRKIIKEITYEIGLVNLSYFQRPLKESWDAPQKPIEPNLKNTERKLCLISSIDLLLLIWEGDLKFKSL